MPTYSKVKPSRLSIERAKSRKSKANRLPSANLHSPQEENPLEEYAHAQFMYDTLAVMAAGLEDSRPAVKEAKRRLLEQCRQLILLAVAVSTAPATGGTLDATDNLTEFLR